MLTTQTIDCALDNCSKQGEKKRRMENTRNQASYIGAVRGLDWRLYCSKNVQTQNKKEKLSSHVLAYACFSTCYHLLYFNVFKNYKLRFNDVKISTRRIKNEFSRAL